MTKKKHASIIGRLENTASDVANALSVAATGSEIGVLELAAEDEFGQRPPRKPKRKMKAAVRKKRAAARKTSKRAKTKRNIKRRKRA